jgi:hypothetical protein
VYVQPASCTAVPTHAAKIPAVRQQQLLRVSATKTEKLQKATSAMHGHECFCIAPHAGAFNRKAPETPRFDAC